MIPFRVRQSIYRQYQKFGKENTYMVGYGNAGDAMKMQHILEQNLLDTWEKGVKMEKEWGILLDYPRHKDGTYDVVGQIFLEDYVTLLKKLREGVCDDVDLISSCPKDDEDDVWDIIRYHDRTYGEKIRQYNLTEKGFFMNIMLFFDED